MDLATRNLMIHLAVLGLGAGLGVFLVCRRVNWRAWVLLMGAGVLSGVLSVSVLWAPIQRALTPVEWMPQPDPVAPNMAVPHDPPGVIIWLAEHGRIAPGGWYSGPGTSAFGPEISYDPSPVCALPPSEGGGIPGPRPNLITMRGWRAFLYVAFGNYVANSMLHGGLRCLYHAGVCALVLFFMRRRAGGLGPADRAWILVVSAWVSAWWPALARFSWLWFASISWAWGMDGGHARTGSELPMADGTIGYSAIWLGAFLGHIAVVEAVTRYRSRRRVTVHAKDDPGRERAARAPGALLARGLQVARWVLIAGLLCAPITLPLLGAVTPAPVLRVVGSLGRPISAKLQSMQSP